MPAEWENLHCAQRQVFSRIVAMVTRCKWNASIFSERLQRLFNLQAEQRLHGHTAVGDARNKECKPWLHYTYTVTHTVF